MALLASAIREPDQVTAIAAVHALGAVFDDGAAAVLSDLLSDDRPFLREHAAWALGSRTPRLDTVGRLVSGVAAGGFATVINQRALRRWAQCPPTTSRSPSRAPCSPGTTRAGRARLVETMGLVPGAVAGRTLLRIAADDQRTARGPAWRPSPHWVTAGRTPAARADPTLARTDGELAGVARLAAFDLGAGTDDAAR